MKIQNILLVPVAFVAGIVSVVLLDRSGLVSITALDDAQVKPSSEVLSEPQNGGLDNEVVTELAKNDLPGTQPASDTFGSIEQLSLRIDQLQQQQRSATRKVDAMQSDIDVLEQQIETALVDNAFLPDGHSETMPSAEAVQQQSGLFDGVGNRGVNRSDSDEQYTSLVAAGIDPAVAEEIKRRSDQWTLQRLELVDQATREGWRRSEQFGERLSELQEERPNIREELGDNEYDRYLFASGEFNRVQIASIIDGSAAQIAGMQNGDIVLSYANRRVFTSRELQQATSAGSRGEPVQLDLLRSGQLVSVELPRGPMGVTLTGTRMEPSAF